MMHLCPCCRFLTLSERKIFLICPVCYWEDDPVQCADIHIEFCANATSLNQARENFKMHGASEERWKKFCREPMPSEVPK